MVRSGHHHLKALSYQSTTRESAFPIPTLHGWTFTYALSAMHYEWLSHLYQEVFKTLGQFFFSDFFFLLLTLKNLIIYSDPAKNAPDVVLSSPGMRVQCCDLQITVLQKSGVKFQACRTQGRRLLLERYVRKYLAFCALWRYKYNTELKEMKEKIGRKNQFGKYIGPKMKVNDHTFQSLWYKF